MKKFISIFLVFLCSVSVIAFAACNKVSHTHTYADEWSYDDVYHWHNATCAHLLERKDVEEHVFDEGTENSATFDTEGYTVYRCIVCGYEKTTETSPVLEHNYSDTLTYDDGDTHWYACTDEGYEYLKRGEEKHNLVEIAFDEETGYATYTCECGYTKRFLRTTIIELPTVSAANVYIGQTLSDVSFSGGSASVDGTFVWTNPAEKIEASGNYYVTFVPDDSEYAPVTGSIEISAQQLTVTVTTGVNGTASGEGVINVDYGTDFTVSFIPDSGYKVEKIIVDGTEVTSGADYSIENVTENHIIEVTFCEMSEEDLTYAVTYVSGTENAYVISGNTLTFTNIDTATVYAISGEMNGNIVIDVGDDYKFDLELTGFSLTCDSVNPITILSGDEVSLTAKKGTQNYVNDNRETIDDTDETLFSAAIYSKVDLEICGKGSLTLISENNNGIHTKDDLQVKNLTLCVTCVDNALKGNDGVEITNANTTLVATRGDCIKTTNSHINADTLNQKGTVSIAGGTHNLYAACDGIDAAYDVLIDDASTVINIYTDKYSEYSEEVTAVSENTYYLRYTSSAYKYSVKYYNSDTDYMWVNVSDDYETVTSSAGGRPGQSNTTYYYYTFAKNTNYSKLSVYMYDSSQTQGQGEDYHACSEGLTVNTNYDTLALSYKTSSLSVSWTNYSTNSSSGGMGGMQEGNPDKGTYSTKGIKAANEITINAGTVYIQSYDDAVHSNNDGGTLENGENPTGNVNINGGTITVYSNDDGIHADGTLTITDGSVTVMNSYEGIEGVLINIQGGNISVASTDDGINATTTSGCGITIAGGTIYVYAGGDGLDSNSKDSYGGILFAGGKTVVICNSNGNSAIDTESGYTHTGGSVVAIMTTGGMTSETANGNSTGMTIKSSVSLSDGGYLTVTVDSTPMATVRMPCAMTAYVVYLGSANATISSATSVSDVLDTNGVFWNTSD